MSVDPGCFYISQGSSSQKNNGDVLAIGNISDPVLKQNTWKHKTCPGIRFRKMASVLSRSIVITF